MTTYDEVRTAKAIQTLPDVVGAIAIHLDRIATLLEQLAPAIERLSTPMITVEPPK